MLWPKYLMGFLINITCLWTCYIIFFSYRNQLPRDYAKKQIVTFRIHLALLVIFCILRVLKPFWSLDVNDVLWNSPILCDIYGRMNTADYTVVLIPIYFAYFKTEFYQEIIEKAKTEHRILKFVMPIGLIVMFVYTIVINPQAVVKDGARYCFRFTKVTAILNSIIALWIFLQYIWIISIFRRSHDELKELIAMIQALESHVRVNRWFCVFLFGTTLGIVLFQSIIVHGICHDSARGICTQNFLLSLTIFDCLLNSLIMFYTIYGFLWDSNADIEDEETTMDALPDTLMSRVDGFNVVWISFPSLPPIQVVPQVIEKNPYLEKYVLKDHLTNQWLNYINTMAHSNVCMDIEEVMDEVEEYQNTESRIEVAVMQPPPSLQPEVVELKQLDQKFLNLIIQSDSPNDVTFTNAEAE